MYSLADFSVLNRLSLRHFLYLELPHEARLPEVVEVRRELNDGGTRLVHGRGEGGGAPPLVSRRRPLLQEQLTQRLVLGGGGGEVRGKDPRPVVARRRESPAAGRVRRQERRGPPDARELAGLLQDVHLVPLSQALLLISLVPRLPFYLPLLLLLLRRLPLLSLPAILRFLPFSRSHLQRLEEFSINDLLNRRVRG